MVRVFLVVALMVAGCGGGPCKERAGSYRFKLTPQSGDCGQVDTVTVFDSQSTDTSGCVGGSTQSEDACDVTVDVTCSDADVSVAMRGKIDWNTDGSYGSGTVSITVSNSNSVACSGVMAATYEKL